MSENRRHDTAEVAETSSTPLKIDDLIDMDVVIYSLENDSESNGSSDEISPTFRFGAMQEDGLLSPLSAWTKEPAFGDSVEFLVDEAERFALVNSKDKICLHHLLSEAELGYGSRQCHRGMGNPHGEESALLYYVEQKVIDKFKVELAIKPELEILW
jgi:hypothetical protein